MKKILLLCLLALASCKNQPEEVSVDQVSVKNSEDINVSNDEVVSIEDEKSEGIEQTQKTAIATAPSDMKYASFGAKMASRNALGKEDMLKKYQSLKAGDTVSVQFKSVIKEVCKKKGCWMSMALPNDKEAFVKFKDYGFFVPLNADNSEAIVSGRAYIDVVSVAELQHFAKDGGKSEDEIKKIIAPKVTYAFQADGVLIKE